MRGILTDSIQEKAVAFLNRTISQKELRLYPYIDYSIKNACQGWSYSKMDEEEIEILKNIKAQHFMLSHRNPFDNSKDSVIRLLDGIYAKRKSGEPYISGIDGE